MSRLAGYLLIVVMIWIAIVLHVLEGIASALENGVTRDSEDLSALKSDG